MDKNKIIFPSDLDKMQQRGVFKIYTSTINRNILFIGSCRTVPLAYYLHFLYPEYNIYLIYLPYWTPEKRLNFNYDLINDFLNETVVIITENATNYDLLNTNKDCKNNFFKSFNTSHCNHIAIPNLELHMYTADIYFEYKNDNFNEYKNIFLKSRERLAKSIDNTQFGTMNEFIDNNLSKIKLFATLNHPTRILSLLTFKILVNKLGFNKNLISLETLLFLYKTNFLEGHSTVIVENDLNLYNFEFLNEPASPNSIIYDINKIRSTTKYEMPNLQKHLKSLMEI